LKIPSNLIIVGTIYDKAESLEMTVLDRCNVIEMTVPDGSAYSEGFGGPEFFSREPEIHPLITSGALIHKHVVEQMASVRVTVMGEPLNYHKAMVDQINTLQQLLDPMGYGLGHRVIQGIMLYLYLSWNEDRQPYSWDDWADALDTQILQRVLPRIHGTAQSLGDTLLSLYRFCFEEPSDNEDGSAARFKRTAQKLRIMLNTLERSGSTSFFSLNV
jgi:5-methylcytosine-specific restriction enzyme B